MNWVSNTPSIRTGFEQFVLQHFGLYVDLSSSAVFAGICVAVLMVPLFFIGTSKSTRR